MFGEFFITKYKNLPHENKKFYDPLTDPKDNYDHFKY